MLQWITDEQLQSGLVDGAGDDSGAHSLNKGVPTDLSTMDFILDSSGILQTGPVALFF